MKVNSGERLMKMETTLDYLKEQQKLMNDTNLKEHQEIKQILKDFTESADKKYATKLTEKMVYGMAGLMLTTIIIAIIKTVIIGG